LKSTVPKKRNFSSLSSCALWLAVLGTASCGAGDRQKLASVCASGSPSSLCQNSSSADEKKLADFLKLWAGNWTLACAPAVEFEGIFKKESHTAEAKGEFVRNIQLFADEGCQTGIFNFRVEGEVLEANPLGSQKYSLLSVLSKASITPVSEAGANILIQSRSCGATDWKSGETKDLAYCTFGYKDGLEGEEKFLLNGMEDFDLITFTQTSWSPGLRGQGQLFIPKPDDRPTQTSSQYSYTKATP
jgi:hypothetical protein